MPGTLYHRARCGTVADTDTVTELCSLVHCTLIVHACSSDSLDSFQFRTHFDSDSVAEEEAEYIHNTTEAMNSYTAVRALVYLRVDGELYFLYTIKKGSGTYCVYPIGGGRESLDQQPAALVAKEIIEEMYVRRPTPEEALAVENALKPRIVCLSCTNGNQKTLYGPPNIPMIVFAIDYLDVVRTMNIFPLMTAELRVANNELVPQLSQENIKCLVWVPASAFGKQKSSPTLADGGRGSHGTTLLSNANDMQKITSLCGSFDKFCS